MSTTESNYGEEENSDHCSDEYHEDGLPDLVLSSTDYLRSSKSLGNHDFVSGSGSGSGSGLHRRESTSSQNSSIDLLTLVGSSGSLDKSVLAGAGGSSGRGVVGGSSYLRASASVDLLACDDHYDEEEYSPTGASEQVLTEVSNRGVFKVSYVDHKKTYIPKVSGSEKYRSYLSLMPDEDDGGGGNDGDKVNKSQGQGREEEEEEENRKEQILNEFKALSYEEQKNQRVDWAKDLEKTDNEIQELKEKLAFKTAWCGVLRRNLGLRRGGDMSVSLVSRGASPAGQLSSSASAHVVTNKLKKLTDSCVELGEKVAQITEKNLNQALDDPRLTDTLQRAKDHFEALTNESLHEVKDRVKQGKQELAKKVAMIKLDPQPAKIASSANQEREESTSANQETEICGQSGRDSDEEDVDDNSNSKRSVKELETTAEERAVAVAAKS